jgi:BirA family biotin operon repressor/biotin-[acetyl-CoA-carboxylase] ligase
VATSLTPAPEHRTPAGGLWGGDLIIFDSLPSTNAWALDHAQSLKHGDVVRAVRQTSGRGRFDRDWVAPGRCNLNLSVIISPASLDAFPASMHLPATAVALRDTLTEFGLASTLKWPNDVMVKGRKIAGILAEMHDATGHLVLGTGLNVNITAPALEAMVFPHPPTSMAVERERLFDIEAVCHRYLIDLEKILDTAGREGMVYIAERWQEADALEGATVTIDTGKATVTGLYAGMQDDGRLAILVAKQGKQLFWSGDVTIVKPPV